MRTHTVIDASTGEVVSVTPLDGPASALDRLAALPTAQAEALVTLALGIVGDAAGLWDALDQMDPGSDARPAIEIVTHHAIEAAIALLEQDPEP